MPEHATLTVERNVPTTMRDATILYSDVYRPSGPGPYPVVLQRTPYDKALTGVHPWVVRAATAGYAAIIQDVRGRYTSEGEFETFVNERPDGFDTLEWLATQPWSDGNVGMFGGSYVGMTQWQAALNNHPSLKAIVPVVTASNYHDGWTYQGGAFELQFNVSWILTALALNTATRVHPGGLSSEVAQALIDDHDAMAAAFDRLPLTANLPFGDYARYYDDWVNHPTYDAFWQALDVRQGHDSMSVASLNIGGWHDIFLGGTIENFTGMRAQSPASNKQHLLLGPWNHGGMRVGNPIGGWDFGFRSTGGYIDEGAIHLRWYDRWLRGEDNGVDTEPPIRLYVMGADTWRSEDEWPLARTEWQNWYFHSDGKANSLNGDGALSRESPGSQPPDSFVYNPRNPVPTAGGGLCCNSVFALGGPQDQRPVEAREDVLVYSTPPLTEAIEVTGPVKVVLHASSSAPDTDFTAKLVDVHPCGYARILTDGIIRARYRNSMSEGTLLTPGDVVTYEIDLWSTSNEFQPGHQIRVEISSSNFPRFDRNPNTGEQPGRSKEMVSALQNVFHSAAHPSHIVLPIIPVR